VCFFTFGAISLKKTMSFDFVFFVQGGDQNNIEKPPDTSQLTPSTTFLCRDKLLE